MKTIPSNERIIYTMLAFICVLGGVFMIGISRETIIGLGVNLDTDFFRALCVAIPVTVVVNGICRFLRVDE